MPAILRYRHIEIRMEMNSNHVAVNVAGSKPGRFLKKGVAESRSWTRTGLLGLLNIPNAQVAEYYALSGLIQLTWGAEQFVGLVSGLAFCFARARAAWI